jgi:heterodisulfide reductase subunit A-like polyferredoxin
LPTNCLFVSTHLAAGENMSAKKEKNGTIGSVLVVGGGIAGMQAALDLANSGYYVYLLEKSPAIGGVMAQLDKIFPTNECAM